MRDSCAASSDTPLKELFICISVLEGSVSLGALLPLCTAILEYNCSTQVKDSWARNPQLGTVGTKKKRFVSVPKLQKLLLSFFFFSQRSE